MLDILNCRSHRKRSTWKCVDSEAFRKHVAASMPGNFTSPSHFHSFLSSAMKDFDSPLSARQRRRAWEPFAIKVLRYKIRETEEGAEHDRLRQKLFQARVAWAKSRDAMTTERELRERKRKPNKKVTLFPLSSIEIENSVNVDHEQWAVAAAQEFQARWKQDSEQDTMLFHALDGGEDSEVSVDPEHVQISAAMLRKRPWVLD